MTGRIENRMGLVAPAGNYSMVRSSVQVEAVGPAWVASAPSLLALVWQ